jgi:DUF1365 family protein
MVKDSILHAKVRHKRIFPTENYFSYKAFYININMRNLYHKTSSFIFGREKIGLMSYREKDHGERNGSSSLLWAENILNNYGIIFDDISLLTMPRVFGYLFNPASFWFVYNKTKLVSIILEVNNTFGETHSYICFLEKGEEISKENWFEAQKVFHVSPFMDISGTYKFNFDWHSKQKRILIHYYDNDRLKLITSVEGNLRHFSKKNLLKCFFMIPFLTKKVFFLIHYQALKIYIKKIKYRPKPKQLEKKVSVAKAIIFNKKEYISGNHKPY